MARKGKKITKEVEEDYGLDEVDAFAKERNDELYEKAGLNDKTNELSSDSDDEEAIEGVMDIDSDVEIEKYKKKFTGPIDESDEEYFKDVNEDEDGEGDEDETTRKGWGGNYYGADEAEDDEDEKLMEQEALRLQKKHMEDLHMEDFMLDETEDWKSESNKKRDGQKIESEIEVKDKFNEMTKMGDKNSRMEAISKRYPEYLPLVLETKKLQPLYEELKENHEDALAKVQFKALSLYLGSIVSYFSVFVNKLAADEPFEMKDEDVMLSILSTRELWRQASTLVEGEEGDDDEEVEEGGEEEEVEIEEEQDSEEVSEDEVSEDEDEDEDSEQEEAEEDEEDSDIEDNSTPDFGELRSLRTQTSKQLEDMDDIDIEDKKVRRKNLRFYTSKIDKRDAGRKTVDGDQDAYYEEQNDPKNKKPVFSSRDRGSKRNDRRSKSNSRGRSRR